MAEGGLRQWSHSQGLLELVEERRKMWEEIRRE